MSQKQLSLMTLQPKFTMTFTVTMVLLLLVLKTFLIWSKTLYSQIHLKKQIFSQYTKKIPGKEKLQGCKHLTQLISEICRCCTCIHRWRGAFQSLRESKPTQSNETSTNVYYGFYYDYDIATLCIQINKCSGHALSKCQFGFGKWYSAQQFLLTITEKLRTSLVWNETCAVLWQIYLTLLIIYHVIMLNFMLMVPALRQWNCLTLIYATDVNVLIR